MQEEMAISGEDTGASHDAGVIEESLPCVKGGGEAEPSRKDCTVGRDTEQDNSLQPFSHGEAVTAPLTQGSRDVRARFRELIGGEYKQAFADEVQRIIDRRFRETKLLEKRVAELEGNNASPVQGEVLSVAKRKGCTVGRDTEQDDGLQPFSQPTADSSPYTGEPLVRQNHANDLLQAVWENDAREMQVREQTEHLRRDLDALREKYPKIDPTTLLESDALMRAYLSGADAEALLWALHHDQLLADAQAAVVESIRARQNRPIENGASGGASFTVRKDFSKMTLEELEAYGKNHKKE